MKRLFHIFMAALAAVLVCSCAGPDKLSFQGCRLGKVSPTGFRSATISVDLKICNSGSKISINQADGTLFAEDSPVGTFSIEPVIIPGHETNWIRLDCSLKLSEGVSIMNILKTVRSRNISGLTVSCVIKARAGLFSRTITKEKVPLTDFAKQ